MLLCSGHNLILGGREVQELQSRLIKDLKKIGIKSEFKLRLRPYSKTYFGRYDPSSKDIILYVYMDSSCKRQYPYEQLLGTAIHEAVHCIQWSDNNFVRIKGVMHNPEFHTLYNFYSGKAKALQLLERIKYDTKLERSGSSFTAIYC